MNIITILNQRYIADFFSIGHLQLENNIADHAAYCFEKIYSIAYPQEADSLSTPRSYHGIAHVSRVASYIPIFANLYRKHHHPDAKALTAEDLHYLQIAALFHDAGRLKEGEDLWDKESAMMCFFYLMTLGCSKEKAKEMAETIANKDYQPGQPYHVLEITKTEAEIDVEWKTAVEYQPKTIYQKLLHDADCLDIIRARSYFDANYLDFYQDIAKTNSLAFEDMALVIAEARSLICEEGDFYRGQIQKRKQYYHSQDAYSLVEKDLDPPKRATLHKLYNGNSLIDQAALNELKLEKPLCDVASLDLLKESEHDLHQAMLQGRLLFRGVAKPSFICDHKKNQQESSAELEMRKASRRLGYPTRTHKSNRDQKHGNPFRSTSTLQGFGMGFYSGVGGVIVPSWENFSIISLSNQATGQGKKKRWQDQLLLSPEEANRLFFDLLPSYKMGGVRRVNTFETHTELLYLITQFHAVCYTNDPTMDDYQSSDSPYPFLPYSRLLQALYLQGVTQDQTGILVPLVEYSGIDHSLKAVKTPEPEELKAIWKSSAHSLLENVLDELGSYMGKISQSLSVQKESKKLAFLLSICFNPDSNFRLFKSACAYGTLRGDLQHRQVKEIDFYYEDTLKDEINAIIADLIKTSINDACEKVLNFIESEKKPRLILNETFFTILFSPHLNDENKQKIFTLLKEINISCELESYLADTVCLPEKKLNNALCVSTPLYEKQAIYTSNSLFRYIGLAQSFCSDEFKMAFEQVILLALKHFSTKEEGYSLEKIRHLLQFGLISYFIQPDLLEDIHEEAWIIISTLRDLVPVLQLDNGSGILIREKDRLVIKEHCLDEFFSEVEEGIANQLELNDFSQRLQVFIKYYPEVMNELRFINLFQLLASQSSPDLGAQSVNFNWKVKSLFLVEAFYDCDQVADILFNKIMTSFKAVFLVEQEGKTEENFQKKRKLIEGFLFYLEWFQTSTVCKKLNSTEAFNEIFSIFYHYFQTHFLDFTTNQHSTSYNLLDELNKAARRYNLPLLTEELYELISRPNILDPIFSPDYKCTATLRADLFKLVERLVPPKKQDLLVTTSSNPASFFDDTGGSGSVASIHQAI